jgi:tetratricopeptide (TPR) repeat protein
MKVNSSTVEAFMRFSGILSRALLVLIAAAFLPWALAQQGGQQGGGTPGSAGTPNTTAPKPPRMPPVIPTTPTDNRNASPSPTNQELLFITGAVVLDDGMPPPFGTVIERACGGAVVRETTVDAAGHFSYQLGDPNRAARVFPDASQAAFGQDPIERDLSPGSNSDNSKFVANMLATPLYSKLAGCELRAQLAGYQSTAIPLGGGSGIGLLEVGTIVMYPMARVRGTSVSATNFLAPKAARKALENARKASRKKELSEAERFINSALEVYPGYAEAWFEWGQLYQQQQLREQARNAYKKAIVADKLFLGPYIGLARLSAKEEKWQDVADITDQALALDPITIPEGHFLNALANYNLDKLDVAEKSALRGQRMDYGNQIPKINLVLANILAKKNNPAGAIEAMKKYLRAAPHAPDAGLIRSRVQETEKIAKSTPKP